MKGIDGKREEMGRLATSFIIISESYLSYICIRSWYVIFYFFTLVTGMQRRTFTIYQTDAPTQTVLAMKKLKMSQEFSSVQLMYLVCIFLREFEKFIDHLITKKEPRHCCSNKGNSGSKHYISSWYIMSFSTHILCLWGNPVWFFSGGALCYRGLMSGKVKCGTFKGF